jgi:hypothetical protein
MFWDWRQLKGEQGRPNCLKSQGSSIGQFIDLRAQVHALVRTMPERICPVRPQRMLIPEEPHRVDLEHQCNKQCLDPAIGRKDNRIDLHVGRVQHLIHLKQCQDEGTQIGPSLLHYATIRP